MKEWEHSRDCLYVVSPGPAPCTCSAGAVFEFNAMAEIEPHAYVPSIMHMGDCSICGHLQGDAIHSPFRHSPS